MAKKLPSIKVKDFATIAAGKGWKLQVEIEDWVEFTPEDSTGLLMVVTHSHQWVKQIEAIVVDVNGDPDNRFDVVKVDFGQKKDKTYWLAGPETIREIVNYQELIIEQKRQRQRQI